MKIIKRGHWPNPTEWTAKHTCTRCASELVIGTEDLVHNNPRQMDKADYHIRCPVCDLTQLILDPPLSVQSALAEARTRE